MENMNAELEIICLLNTDDRHDEAGAKNAREGALPGKPMTFFT